MYRIDHKRAISFGFLSGFAIVFALNYISYLRNVCPTTIDDCGWSFGFPLHFYREGGFVTFKEIIWLGLFIDILFSLGFSLLVGLAIRFLWSKYNLKELL